MLAGLVVWLGFSIKKERKRRNEILTGPGMFLEGFERLWYDCENSNKIWVWFGGWDFGILPSVWSREGYVCRL